MAPDYNGLDFRLVVESRNAGPPLTITLVASTTHEKAAWCSDISQCIENLQYTDIINNSMCETSSVSMPQSVRSDPKLYRDDVDIKFSQSLNSCKVPQIRHASVSRLLDRLIDLRFLSIDFLNTFLLTYRVFTTGQCVLDALRRVYKNPEYGNLEFVRQNCVASLPNQRVYLENDDACPLSSPPKLIGHTEFVRHPPTDTKHLVRPVAEKLRRISTGTTRIEVKGERNYLAARLSDTAAVTGFRRYKREESCASSSCSSSDSQPTNFQLALPKPKLAPIASCETVPEGLDQAKRSSSESLELSPVSSADDIFTASTTITITTSTESSLSSMMSSAKGSRLNPETSTNNPNRTQQSPSTHFFPFGTNICDRLTLTNSLKDASSTNIKGLSVPTCFATGFSLKTRASSFSASQLLSTATSSNTLIPCSPHSMPSSPKRSFVSSLWSGFPSRKVSAPSVRIPASDQLDALALSPVSSPRFGRVASPLRRVTSPSMSHMTSPVLRRATSPSPVRSLNHSPKLSTDASSFSNSSSFPNIITHLATARSRIGRSGSGEMDLVACGFCAYGPCPGNIDHTSPTAKPGTVVTSSRASRRRSSSAAAAAAFAVATAGSPHPKDSSKSTNRHLLTGSVELKPHNNLRKRESLIYSAATLRVLSVLRHWVTKYSRDFESDPELKSNVVSFLEEILNSPNLLPTEYRSSAGILSVLLASEEKEISRRPIVDLDVLLAPPEVPATDNFETLSALDIAEQLTYLDHQIFMALGSEELFGQAWMKPDKATRAPHVLLVSKRFNEASRLVVSEIVRRPTIVSRVSCIEKWAAIADICRCMHNYNGILQICAAFVNSSVFRLKKTWEKISKQSKQMIERLQSLVSSDGRFKNMREALHRCDPPCIPYLGMYLSDLSFIEEGSSNITDDGLINFSKMRMIAHVIREIQLFQQTPYKIEHYRRVTNYLLDPSNLLDEEQAFRFSLEIEPRCNLSSVSGQVV